jgi:hypothetical protein
MKTRVLCLVMVSAWAFAGEGEPDRIIFPAEYARQLRQLGESLFQERSGVTTVYANELAADAAKSGATQFPEGAIIVMEFAKPVRNADGELLRDARGTLLKGEIEHVDVMQRGRVAGDDANRAGHWNFASFGADGATLVAPGDAAKCANCHRNAGAEKDFVFRTRPWTAAK